MLVYNQFGIVPIEEKHHLYKIIIKNNIEWGGLGREDRLVKIFYIFILSINL